MEAITILTTGFLCIACFVIGAKVGQTVSKGEKVVLPSINPMKAIRESQAKKAAEMKKDKLDTILQNIDRYDGTSKGQQDVG